MARCGGLSIFGVGEKGTFQPHSTMVLDPHVPHSNKNKVLSELLGTLCGSLTRLLLACQAQRGRR